MSRGRIRRTTYAELPASAPGHGLNAKKLPSPMEECAEEQTANAVELRTLDPAYLSNPNAIHRRA